MVKIFLRSKKRTTRKDTVYYLAMRDSNGNEGNNELETEVRGGSKVSWELEKESGIRNISRIYGGGKKSKVFKKDPDRVLGQKKFIVDVVETEVILKEEYFIDYTLDTGETVTIDPYIKVLPPD